MAMQPEDTATRRKSDFDQITLAVIDCALQAKSWLTPMPAVLATSYAAGQRAERRLHNRRVILIMTIIFDLFLFAQVKSAPEVLRASAILRLGFTPVVLAFILLDATGRLRRLYAPFLVTTAVLPTVISAILTLMTSHHNITAISDIHAIPLILLATGVVARLTPAEVFSNVAVSVACFCASVLLAPFIPSAQIESLLLTDIAIGAAAIVFNLQLESRDRRVFLLHTSDTINRAALAARNRFLLAETQTDGLTGVANRRCFDETFAAVWRECAITGNQLGLIILDIDHFKKFNDRYGHQGGDDCLRRVATTASQEVRQGDLFARYGGEEFVVILPGAALHAAAAVAERMRAAVAALFLPHEGAGVGALVTISLGVAAMSPRPCEDPRQLIEAADANLFGAKRAGRDRVCAAMEVASQ